jgi:serine/threonine protein kinase
VTTRIFPFFPSLFFVFFSLCFFLFFLQGLQYLHAERILHRDLKPSNILLTAQGERALIGDLGFGRLLNTGERWALTGVGTPLCVRGQMMN